MRLQQQDTEAQMRAGRGDTRLNAAKTVEPDLFGGVLHPFAGRQSHIRGPRQHAVDRCDGNPSSFGQIGDGRAAHGDSDLLSYHFERMYDTNETISCFRYHGGLI